MKLSPFFLLILLVFSTNAQDQAYQMAEGLDHYEDLFNASNNDSISCFRIPALVTAPNGDVLAAIDERIPSCNDLRGSDDINIVLRRSTDNGKTWSPIETVVDFPLGESASDPSMIVDEMTNEIFLFYNFMNLDTEKDIYYLHVVKSDDNGKTWSRPQDITDQIAKPKWRKDFKFITSGRGIQTRGGKLLHCMVNLNSGMHIFGSDDHGKSWFFIDTPIMPADESKIVELEDGRWMVNARANDKQRIRYVHISSDEGKTWTTEPEPQLKDPGCNASIIRYTSIKDGYKKSRMLFANANSVDERTNLTVRVSYDEGKTWSNGKTIYRGSAAYSSLTILDNGNIGVFFEKDDYTQNMFASFSLNWLTDGKDKYRKPKKGK
ncbi:sialidase-1 [Pricia antarctica]|uniref:exo-alpha-sialidase n=1 Tax=Pricia antarctica TaxID=641691 RepID=A0A1G6WG13_9FLAO|nr:sialidase family protein [Pricia antarctica]SDD64748.1 sialidase-1 [Pricia antarctica]